MFLGTPRQALPVLPSNVLFGHSPNFSSHRLTAFAHILVLVLRVFEELHPLLVLLPSFFPMHISRMHLIAGDGERSATSHPVD